MGERKRERGREGGGIEERKIERGNGRSDREREREVGRERER